MRAPIDFAAVLSGEAVRPFGSTVVNGPGRGSTSAKFNCHAANAKLLPEGLRRQYLDPYSEDSFFHYQVQRRYSLDQADVVTVDDTYRQAAAALAVHIEPHCAREERNGSRSVDDPGCVFSNIPCRPGPCPW